MNAYINILHQFAVKCKYDLYNLQDIFHYFELTIV